MPTYTYFCHRCEMEFDVIKPMKEYDRNEICAECGLESSRVINFSGHLAADNQEAYYNYGLGKVVRSKNDVRQELSRVKGETGREFHEIGNDRSRPAKRKSKLEVTDEMIADYKRGYTKR